MDSLIEIVDEFNVPTGRVATVDEVNDNGYWCRGVHGIIITPDDRVVVQKRSAKIFFHPNMLDISFGGGIDAGETPDQAVMRELKEELGITVRKDQLHFVGVWLASVSTTTHGRHTINILVILFIVML